MSDDQSLSTEDLAGRPAPSNAATPVAPASAGSTDPGQPPVAGAADDDRLADQGDREATERVTYDGQRGPDGEDVFLVDPAQVGLFRARWGDVQARFVDDPKAAVGAADGLVAELMQSLASGFADHKSRLETQWHGGGEADTEALRLALRRYRSFFDRLLET
jgi:hypothetical protein